MSVMCHEEKLKQVISTLLKIAPESINENTSMDNTSTWDSLQHMNLILALEEEFKVCIPDDDASNITSYPVIRAVIKELLENKR